MEVLQLSESLTKGLRPEAWVPRNAPYLIDCRGLRPSAGGLRALTTPSDPISGGTLNYAHPFPQLFEGKAQALLAYADTLYSISRSAYPWTASLYSLHSATSRGAELVTNGDFSGGTPPTPTAWTLGSGVTWNSTAKNLVYAASNIASSAYEAISVTSGAMYEVKFTVTFTQSAGKYGGSFGVGIQSSTPTGPIVTESGSYTQVHVAGSTGTDLTLIFRGAGIVVDDVSVKAISAGTISGGGIWHLADFGSSWFLFNGTVVAFKLPGTGQLPLVATAGCTTGCANRGRLVLGAPTAIFGSTMWGTTTTGAGYSIGRTTTLPANSIWWSTIGREESLYPWMPALIRAGALTELESRGDAGMLVMPWEGTVYMVKELGEGIVVYGDRGISVLKPVQDPIPTYAVVETLGFGVPSRGAVTGDVNQHYFVDKEGSLWRLGADVKMERLGYKEYISTLTGTVIMAYDDHEGDAYICDATYGYMYGGDGLSELPYLVTSCVWDRGATQAIYKALSDDDISVQSNWTDMGLRTVKTVKGVQIGGDHPDQYSVSLYARMHAGDTPITVGPVSVGADGMADIRATGVEFSVLVTSTAYSSRDLESLMLWWDAAGARALKGYVA